jgi:CRP/FNR family transcriptional regulator
MTDKNSAATCGKNYCTHCNLHKHCSFSIQSNTGMKIVMPYRQRNIERSEGLYHAGDICHEIYMVRRGFFKTFAITEEGEEQILSFNMAGDIIGIDGVESGIHSFYVTALETSEVCVLPITSFSHATLLEIMHKEIHHAYNMMLRLGGMSAQKRIITFLFDLLQRLSNYKLADNNELELKMTREEIGRYLAMKVETVSRGFTQLSHLGLIDVRGKYIRLTQKALLSSTKKSLS